MGDLLDLSSFSCAVLISHAVVKTSATTWGPLFTINLAMLNFPSIFCLFANTNNSVLLIPFWTINSELSNGDRCFFSFVVAQFLIFFRNTSFNIRVNVIHTIIGAGGFWKLTLCKHFLSTRRQFFYNIIISTAFHLWCHLSSLMAKW